MTDKETVTGVVINTYNSKSELPRYERIARPGLDEDATFKLVRVDE